MPWLGKTVEHPEGYGIYFQQRWDEAIQANPQFLYINDWNEWTAGKYQPGGTGQPSPSCAAMARTSFVDQYNAEFNRSIQPMKGGYTDNYYMQMAENIRRYKGVRPIPVLGGLHSVTIDGDFGDWAGVNVEYRDTIGDTVHRDYPGYGGLHYQDDSGRNDIVTCKVAVDDDNVYFYAETNEPLTPHTGTNWMLLLIDADRNHDTGWYGYDYLVNQKIVDGNTTTLMRYDAASPDHPWVEQAQLQYRYSGNKLELAIPRQLIGLRGDCVELRFSLVRQSGGLEGPDFAVHQRRQRPQPAFQLPLHLEKVRRDRSAARPAHGQAAGAGDSRDGRRARLRAPAARADPPVHPVDPRCRASFVHSGRGARRFAPAPGERVPRRARPRSRRLAQCGPVGQLDLRRHLCASVGIVWRPDRRPARVHLGVVPEMMSVN